MSFQPFSDVKLEDQDGMSFLVPPSKHEARTIVEDTLQSTEALVSPPVEENGDQTSEESPKKREDEEKNQYSSVIEASDGSSEEDNCTEGGGNELKRKSIFKFLQPPAKTRKMSEVDVYLSEPLVENNSSVLYWKSAVRFPQLQAMAKKLLAIPATSGGFDRLCPMAACIVKAKRNRLPAHTTERLLLYKNSLKTKTVKKSSIVTKS